MAVGIFDSGLGGLTVLDAVQKRLPDVPFVYLGDSANTPYGVRTPEDIYNLTTAAVQRLFDEGCDLVILACNTASAAALRKMQENWIPKDKRVLGVFVPLIESLTQTKITAAAIQESLEASAKASVELDAQRNSYRPFARAGSAIFFLSITCSILYSAAV